MDMRFRTGVVAAAMVAGLVATAGCGFHVNYTPAGGASGASSSPSSGSSGGMGGGSGSMEGSSGGQSSVSGDQLAQAVSAALQKKVGRAPTSVSCPSGVQLKAGATARCSLVDDQSRTYGLTVTLTQMNADGKYHLDIQVDNQPS
jgi:hypothetical protein